MMTVDELRKKIDCLTEEVRSLQRRQIAAELEPAYQAAFRIRDNKKSSRALEMVEWVHKHRLEVLEGAVEKAAK